MCAIWRYHNKSRSQRCELSCDITRSPFVGLIRVHSNATAKTKNCGMSLECTNVSVSLTSIITRNIIYFKCDCE